MRDNLQNVLLRELENAGSMIIPVVTKRIRGEGEHGDGSGFSTPYSRSHTRRREREGLQTSYKDLTFSGTMLDNFKITERSSNAVSARVTLAFQGQSKRRRDQKSATNQQVADWLSGSRHENKNIVKLSRQEEEMVSNYMEQTLPSLLENVSTG